MEGRLPVAPKGKTCSMSGWGLCEKHMLKCSGLCEKKEVKYRGLCENVYICM